MPDYSSLTGIEVFFKPHVSPDLHRVTQQLDGHYSDIVPIDKLKPLFEDQNPSKGLTTKDPLKDTTAELIMTIIQTELIVPRATDTADPSSITIAMNRAKPMVQLPGGRTVRLNRTRLIQLLDDTIASTTNTKLAAIYIDVDTWFYPADAPPEITDFALVSEWKGKQAVPAVQQSQTTGHTSPSPPPPSTPPGPTPQGSDNFAPNLRLLPSDALERYNRRITKSGYVLRSHINDPFVLPDGTTMWYCPTGQWQFMLPDGTIFTKPVEIDKKNLRALKIPLSNDTPHIIRAWLEDVAQTMNNAQCFFPPFFAHRPDRGAQGFSVGDTADDDLPLYMAGHIRTMATLLHQWLLAPGVIPSTSAIMDVVKLARGDGYVAINSIMQMVHPLEIATPTDLIPHFPRQATTESFAQYFLRSVDYLQLCALILDVDVSFDDYSQQDFLIRNSLHSDFLNPEVAKFRQDPRYENLFTGQHILTVIGRIIAQPHSPFKDLYRAPPQKEVKLNSSSYQQNSWKQRHTGNYSRRTPPVLPSAEGTSTNPIRINRLAVFQQDSDSEPDFDAELDAWEQNLMASVPDTEEDKLIAHTFVARINAVGTKDLMKPRPGRQCLFCDEIHSFDTCPYYNSRPYLQSCAVALQQLKKRESVARRRLQESSDFQPGRS